jgi:hypothetical protein
MSDEWKIYPCQMGPDRAWIMFDFGISKTINTVAPPQILRIRIAFKHPREDGMPTNEEFPELAAVDEGVKAMVHANGGLYVGRITVAGQRHFYIYTPEDDGAWKPRLATLAKRFGYPVASYIERDEQRNGYWKELYPDEASWQVMKDMEVLEVLRKQGDDGTTSRRIEHWAYFPAKADAEQYAKWAGEQGYQTKPARESKDGQFVVSFSHEGVLELTAITSHTIRLNRTAKEHRGEYDGWETPVCTGGKGGQVGNDEPQTPEKQTDVSGPKGSWVHRLLGRWRAR